MKTVERSVEPVVLGAQLRRYQVAVERFHVSRHL
ncbi:hypothetical protein F444_21481 [Phytophthora nicotianae P1976]|uniref:Uncharacterized protein n=1 Tax=Phytophthora nicotianae P1976 TaxID=1317066 RepID=A0A080Z0Z3_PHYNI|nr:hypothetical protein F444_21481 [Phytophthora nicotianae P1976]